MNVSGPFSERLNELYAVLSEAEQRDLTRYVASAYFNRDNSLLLFHRFLLKEKADQARYDKQRAWRSVFGKKAFDEKKFRYMVSDLAAAIEEFIYAQQVLNKKPYYAQLMNEYYNQREAHVNRSALANKIARDADRKKSVIRPSDFLEQYFESALLEELHTSSLKRYARYISGRRSAEPGGLDIYYTIEKLRQLCIVANENNVLGGRERCFYQDEALKLASSNGLKQNIFIDAYLEVFEMLSTKKEDHYYKLKEIIHNNGYEMDEGVLAELLQYARNFCIAKVNTGNSAYFEELFDLYQEGLSKRVLLINGEISPAVYKNIVTTALRTGKYEWTVEFINDYHYSLNKTVRENAYNYNLANYFFHTGKYGQVLRNLQKVQLTDLFYGLDARSLMIKCYYETDEKEAFMNAYNSFRIFVQRRKNVSEQHRRNYHNFLRIAKKLMNIRPRDKKAVDKIAAEIKNAKAIADKGWLEEKVKVYL
jgi:hypothetical protein